MLPDSRGCTKCGLDKPLSEFSKHPRGKYGLKPSCKACDAAFHRAKNPPRPRPPRQIRAPLPLDTPKTCRKCGVTKTLADFSLSRRATPTGCEVYRSDCKPCCSARALRWFADNPERTLEANRRRNLRVNYGLSLDDYQALLRKQGNVCAVCGDDEPNAHGRTGKKFRLSVDHCHKTGAIRGLLCQRCNRAIGLLRDDPVLLRRAISYLLSATRKAGNQGGQ